MIPKRATAACLALALALFLGGAAAGRGLAYHKQPEAFLSRARRAVLAAPGLNVPARRKWLGRGLGVLASALARGLPQDLALDVFQTSLDRGWPPEELERLFLRLSASGLHGGELRRLALVMLWRRMQELPLQGEIKSRLHPGQATISTRRFVATLKDWLGTPYLYGGKQTGAIDCSGFVRAVYLANGVNLPDGSWNQASAGRAVVGGPLKLGDILVFKKSDGQVNHVGIYLGKRHFVHSVGGQGVVVSTLDQARFKRMYAGARRVARFRGRAELDSWYLFS